MLESLNGQNASRVKSRCERFPTRHECRFGTAETRTVRAESQRLGAECRAESGFPKRSGSRRVETRGDFKAAHGSRRSRCARTMDCASDTFVRWSHLANHARNCARMGPAQRSTTDPSRGWFARSNRSCSPADARHAQHQKRARPWCLHLESVDLISMTKSIRPFCLQVDRVVSTRC